MSGKGFISRKTTQNLPSFCTKKETDFLYLKHFFRKTMKMKQKLCNKRTKKGKNIETVWKNAILTSHQQKRSFEVTYSMIFRRRKS